MNLMMPASTKLWCDREGRMTPHKFLGHSQSASDQIWYPAYSCDSGDCFNEKLLIPGAKIRPGEYLVYKEKNLEVKNFRKKKSAISLRWTFFIFFIILMLFFWFFA